VNVPLGMLQPADRYIDDRQSAQSPARTCHRPHTAIQRGVDVPKGLLQPAERYIDNHQGAPEPGG
jgi:hypothetical protein